MLCFAPAVAHAVRDADAASPGREQRPRVCLLTGASGRLGSAFITRHGAAYSIAAVHRSRQPVAAPGPAAEGEGGAGVVFPICSDLSRPDEVRRVVDVAMARFGAVDVVVNAAAHAVWGPLVRSRALLESLSEQLRVNVEVPVRLIEAVAQACWRDRPVENRSRNRNVVNVGSTAGLRLYRGGGRSVYAASKAALGVLSVYLADELAELGVRVNVLVPDSFPRIVTTDSVADAVERLDRSDASGRIVVLDADGERGMTLAETVVPADGPSRP